MDGDNVLAALREFANGTRPIRDWVPFWEKHATDIENVVTRGELLRLKPRIAGGHSETTVFSWSLEEIKKVLAKRGVECKVAAEVTAEIGEDRVATDRRIDFGGDVLIIAMDEFAASVPSEIRAQWYSEFQAEGEPANQRGWIRARMKGIFQFESRLPQWMGEPNWPWIDGRPMVFLAQWTCGDSPPLDAAMQAGEIVYMFSLRVNDRCEVRTVSQIPGIDTR